MEKNKTPQKPKLRNRYGFTLEKKDMEFTRGKSLTVQDDSFTIKEILEKFTRGIDPMISKVGHFPDDDDPDYDDEDLESFNKLEIGEQREIVEDTTTRGKNAKMKLDKIKKDQENAAQEAAIKARIEAESKKIEEIRKAEKKE